MPRGGLFAFGGEVVVVCLFWCGLLGCLDVFVWCFCVCLLGCLDVRLDALELVFRLVYVC